MCAMVSSAFPQAHVVELPLFPMCIAASIPCAQTVETSPCGPWVGINLLPTLRES